MTIFYWQRLNLGFERKKGENVKFPTNFFRFELILELFLSFEKKIVILNFIKGFTFTFKLNV